MLEAATIDGERTALHGDSEDDVIAADTKQATGDETNIINFLKFHNLHSIIIRANETARKQQVSFSMNDCRNSGFWNCGEFISNNY